MIVSIGYSTCHWCHVMEHDSFENEEVAALMNDHFIPVKVDREERPDIDSVYMQAVQLMTGKGGWPLNCITLPDGKPLYGGTFFPRMQWINVLKQISDLWKFEPKRCRQYANELIAGIRKTELISKNISSETDISEKVIHEMYKAFESSFDSENGGYSRAPKFPMPDNLKFFLRYFIHSQNETCRDHVLLTLDKMAMGGLYDHLAGGFARYSTDLEWKVPHFEKMLYDNAQLIDVYADAFKLTGKLFYKEVVRQTMSFIEENLTDENGGFYSALDADTEGEEGKFYVWNEKEIENALQEDATLFKEAYSINKDGFWEEEKYILLRKKSFIELAEKCNLKVEQVEEKLNECRRKLLLIRNKRTAPGLDNKLILAWNSMMIHACCKAYDVLNDKKLIEMAERTFTFIQENLKSVNGRLLHSSHPDIISKAKPANNVQAFADDYSFYIRACIGLFSVTLNSIYFEEAIKTFHTADELFTDPDTGLLFYTASGSETLITRRVETEDNVIASSNSVFAESLFILSRLTGNAEWEERCKRMLAQVVQFMPRYPSAFANWGNVLMNIVFSHGEVIVTGPAADELVKQFKKQFQPYAIIFGLKEKNDSIPAFKNRFVNSESRIYVCSGNVCHAPVTDFQTANNLIIESLKR